MRSTSHLPVVVVALLLLLRPSAASGLGSLFPEIEITLANDGLYPVWFMCQMTDHADSLYELSPNSTYRFDFEQVAFPMRWCYLYISQTSHGFFWAFTVRSRCTKCFWSINRHPSLYRADKGRWERQKLFMPPDFNITRYVKSGNKDDSDSDGSDS
ncbi:calcium-dependent phospholipid-binding protein [Striga asiatica]|uniref:Calcium-dependent phospholipid-binding protein n=1 Tax=Striga asiatica TaxID=4170 RepID=A0A5A7PVR2_STRAF|nr:calcium-dependent phospholipid-binding protein [Striga asiatica]